MSGAVSCPIPTRVLGRGCLGCTRRREAVPAVLADPASGKDGLRAVRGRPALLLLGRSRLSGRPGRANSCRPNTFGCHYLQGRDTNPDGVACQAESP